MNYWRMERKGKVTYLKFYLLFFSTDAIEARLLQRELVNVTWASFRLTA